MKFRASLLSLVLLTVIILGSCRKNNEADILVYKTIGQESVVEIDNTSHTIELTFPEAFDGRAFLQSEFLLSEGASATVNGVTQISGKTSNIYNNTLEYTIRSESHKRINKWQILSTNSPIMGTWGMGRFKENEASNDKDYEWYIDQSTTGTYSSVNCGPSSTTMAAKWADKSFAKTAQDARATYRSTGGWWYTSDIINYLNNNNIQNYIAGLYTSETGTQQVIRSKIDDGNIVILCLDMYYISPETDVNQHIDKFYTTSETGWGHFIVVKGYKIVDDHVWFEVYDPYSYGKKYLDGMIKGKNRYYRSSDIFKATSIWWNYSIVIVPRGSKKAIPAGLDPASIPVQWGR